MKPALARRYALAIGAAAFCLGLAVRLRHYVAGPSYWYDEAYVLLNVRTESLATLLGPLRFNTVAPPFFLWTLRGLHLLLGGDEWAMRLPSLACAVTALGLMVPLARRVVGDPGWLVAVALAALSHHGMAHAYDVKPYSGDLLATEVILLLAAVHIGAPGRAPRWLALALPTAAALAPWCSFPSVFVLGAASVALMLHARTRGWRSEWRRCTAMNTVLLGSVTCLWWVQARHLHYPGLREQWTLGWHGFPPDHSPAALAVWSVRCLIGIGHYGSTGRGVILLVPVAIGLAAAWRRSPALAVLLLGPIAAGWLAAVAGVYPMGDRTVFYAAPCIWLLAALGINALLHALSAPRVWAGAALAAVLIVPQLARTVKHLVVVTPRADFRGALAHALERRAGGDACWVSHPEVLDVYYDGRERCLGSYTSPDDVAAAVAGRRLWVVAPPLADWPGPYPARLDAFLASLGLVPTTRAAFAGLDAVRYEPAGRALTTVPAPAAGSGP